MEGKETLLVVEDQKDCTVLLEAALENVGFSPKVYFAPSGEDAFGYLFEHEGVYGRRNLPRLVLLDINLPGLNGFDVLAALRADRHYKGISVVMCSTSSDQDDIRRAYRLGANGYIIKPGSMSDWIKLARSIHEFWYNSKFGPYWMPGQRDSHHISCRVMVR